MNAAEEEVLPKSIPMIIGEVFSFSPMVAVVMDPL